MKGKKYWDKHPPESLDELLAALQEEYDISMSYDLPSEDDIAALKAELEALTDEEYDEDYPPSVFWRSWLHAAPSGKFYTFWANSNLETCPHCGGAGHAKSTDCVEYANLMVDMAAITKKGNARGWTSALNRQSETIRRKMKPFFAECPFCQNLGSHEALADELYTEMLDALLDDEDLCQGSSEGDPTDIVVSAL